MPLGLHSTNPEGACRNWASVYICVCGVVECHTGIRKLWATKVNAKLKIWNLLKFHVTVRLDWPWIFNALTVSWRIDWVYHFEINRSPLCRTSLSTFGYRHLSSLKSLWCAFLCCTRKSGSCWQVPLFYFFYFFIFLFYFIFFYFFYCSVLPE